MPTTHITDLVIGRNDDGSEFVEHGNVLVTHDSDGDDRLLCDTDAGMLELALPDAAELHRALGVMLDRADPGRTMRQRVTPLADGETLCERALADFEERRAHTAAADYPIAVLASQVAAVESGAWAADPAEERVWRRALAIASERAA